MKEVPFGCCRHANFVKRRGTSVVEGMIVIPKADRDDRQRLAHHLSLAPMAVVTDSTLYGQMSPERDRSDLGVAVE